MIYNIILTVLCIGLLISCLLFRNKHLKRIKELDKKLEDAQVLLRRWNVLYKDRVLIEKQKRKFKN